MKDASFEFAPRYLARPSETGQDGTYSALKCLKVFGNSALKILSKGKESVVVVLGFLHMLAGALYKWLSIEAKPFVTLTDPQRDGRSTTLGSFDVLSRA